MNTKKTYTISEVAKILGVSSKTLRRWESKGVISPIRTLGNQRRYTETNIAILKQKLQKTTPYLPEPTQKITPFSKEDLISKLGVTNTTINRWKKSGKIIPSEASSKKTDSYFISPQHLDKIKAKSTSKSKKETKKDSPHLKDNLSKDPKTLKDSKHVDKKAKSPAFSYVFPSLAVGGFAILLLILLSRTLNPTPLPEEQSQATYIDTTTGEVTTSTLRPDVGYFL